MSLEFQNVSIPFAQGIDSKTDKKLVQLGKLTVLENGVMTIGNKIKKRNGYRPASLDVSQDGASIDSLTSGQKLAVFENELIQFNNNALHSYDSNKDVWIKKGVCYSVVCDVDISKASKNNLNQVSSAVMNNYECIAACEDDANNTLSITIRDTTTKNVIRILNPLNTAISPKVLALGSSFYIFAATYGGGTNQLWCYRVSALDPTSVTLDSFQIATTGDPIYDCAVSGSKMVVVYRKSSGDMGLFYLTQDLDIGSPTIGLPAEIIVTPSVAVTDVQDKPLIKCLVEQTTGKISLYWLRQGTLYYKVYNPDFTVGVTEKTQVIQATASGLMTRIAGSVVSATQNLVLVEYYTNLVVNGTTYKVSKVVPIYTQYVATYITLGTIVQVDRLYTDPFLVNDTIFFVAMHGNANYMIVDINSNVVASLSQFEGSQYVLSTKSPEFAYKQGRPVTVDEDIVYFAAQVKAKYTAEVTPALVSGEVTIPTTFTNVDNCKSYKIDFDNTNAFQAETINKNLHISGGFLQVYDGYNVVEHSYFQDPYYSAAASAGGGGTLTTGSYLFYVVYEWIDNKGNVHRSTPGLGVTVSYNSGTSNSIKLNIKGYMMTAKDNVKAVVYVTDVNATLPYRLTELDAKQAAYFSYTYSTKPSDLTTREILYTTGGILENTQQGAVKFLAVLRDRILLSGLENPLEMRYSKQYIDGEGIELNYGLSTLENATGGNITGLSVLDDKAIIFKEKKIVFRSGDGANDLGVNASFSGSELISSDVGCDNQASIVNMPLGLMFKSDKGIYSLTRSLQVEYSGADVELYNTQNITSSDFVPDKNQIRFLTDDGKTLMYDYYFKQWSTFTNHQGLDAVIWNNTYVYLRNGAGEVYKSDDSYFLDKSSNYALKIGTAWLKFAGVQGFQRIQKFSVLGDLAAKHALKVGVYYDYKEYFQDLYVFNAASILDFSTYGDDAIYGDGSPYGGVSDNLYQFQGILRIQKCQSIKFVFEDVPTNGPGEAYSLTDLSLIVGIKKGLYQVRPGKLIDHS